MTVTGQIRDVSKLDIDGHSVIVTGRWLKIAKVHDEAFWKNGEAVTNPKSFIARLKQWHLKPDLFEFAENRTPLLDIDTIWNGTALQSYR